MGVRLLFVLLAVPLDLVVLRRFGDKGLIFGVVDVGDSRIETVEEIEVRIKQVLHHVAPDRLSAGPDCGMVFLDPDGAMAKLTNLVESARRVRESLNESAAQVLPPS